MSAPLPAQAPEEVAAPPSPVAAQKRRRLRLLEAGVLGLAAVGALLFHLRLPSTLPSEQDYAAVADVLRNESQPGDVVLLHPWWAEQARLFVPAHLPVVGYQGSDRDPLTPHPRIWVLSAPDTPRAGRAPLAYAQPVSPERRLGRLTLTLYANDRHRPVRYSAADAIGSAQVFVETPDGVRHPCSANGGRHQCPWGASVAAEWHEVRFQPRRCMAVRPPSGNASLVIEFPGGPLEGELSLQGGMIWDRGHFKRPGISITRLAVEDSQRRRVAELLLPPGLEGLHQVSAPAPAGPFRLVVHTPNPELREPCVELFVYGPSARGTR